MASIGTDRDLVECDTLRAVFLNNRLELPCGGYHCITRSALASRHHSYGHAFPPCVFRPLPLGTPERRIIRPPGSRLALKRMRDHQFWRLPFDGSPVSPK